MTSLRRAFSLGALAVVTALAAQGCAGTGQAVAATVDGQDISRAQLDGDLRALVDNKAFVGAVNQQGQSVVNQGGSVDSGVAAAWLQSMMVQLVVDHDFEHRHLHVNQRDRAAVLQNIEQQFGSAQIFARFGRTFRDRLVDREARVQKLRESLGSLVQPSETALRAFFEQNRAQACPSGKLVSHILVATKDQADQIEGQLTAGADFATLAQRQSRDSSSAARGGLLGCLGAQRYVAEFQQAAEALAVGATSAPVQTQFGWHVIRVTPYTFEGARSDVVQAYTQQNGDPFATYVNRLFARAKLWVDPRYGTLRRSGGDVRLVAPSPPSPRSKPSPPTTRRTTPTATGSQGGGSQGGGSQGTTGGSSGAQSGGTSGGTSPGGTPGTSSGR